MLNLLSITVDVAYARRLWAHPSNVVFVDLEIIGKQRRQASRDTVINTHAMADAERLAGLSDRGPLLVRTNAPEFGAADEAVALARLGVDRIMLPMFRERREVDEVVRALEAASDTDALPPRLTLLAETQAAVEGLEGIVGGQPEWVDTVYVGLNDLSLERGTGFLFEPLATDEIASLARRAKALGRRFGFGGLGMPGSGSALPAEWILGEHVRVGSDAVILSRAFHANVDDRRSDGLSAGIDDVRRWENHWRGAGPEVLEDNHRRVKTAIQELL